CQCFRFSGSDHRSGWSHAHSKRSRCAATASRSRRAVRASAATRRERDNEYCEKCCDRAHLSAAALPLRSYHVTSPIVGQSWLCLRGFRGWEGLRLSHHCRRHPSADLMFAAAPLLGNHSAVGKNRGSHRTTALRLESRPNTLPKRPCECQR